MKTVHQMILTGLVLGAITVLVVRLFAAEPPVNPAFEYVTIRWDGKENTHIVRPGGQVEFIGTELRKVRKPDRADDRAFYMNLAMNGLTKEGFEFVGMTNEEIVMRKAVAR